MVIGKMNKWMGKQVQIHEKTRKKGWGGVSIPSSGQCPVTVAGARGPLLDNGAQG